MRSRPVRGAISRFFLLAGGLGYIALVSINLAGQWLLEHPTPENLSRGIRWFPGNSSLWTAYARYSLIVSGTSEPAKAVDAYSQAASLNPLEPLNWEGLAAAYLEMGKPEKAEAALRGALVALPRSPQTSWRLANFLIVQGRVQDAFPYLRRAATYSPDLRVPVFDLSWKLLTDPELILREIVPAGVEPRRDYFSFLLQRRKLVEAYPVWAEIRSVKGPAVWNLGYAYVDALAMAGMGEEAARVWQHLLQSTGRTAAKPPAELLTNGDFEVELPNAGLDWHLNRGPGYQIGLDNFVFQQGTRSLRVLFDGTSNPDFAGVGQMVPVEPNRQYRFRGYLRTENITTDNGVFFSISSAATPSEEAFLRTTENRVGTTPWLPEQLDFQTGPHTRVVFVFLRRLQSNKLNSLIQGKVWIDNASLTQLPN